VKPNINSVEVHPQLSDNGHPLDDALVGAGTLWPCKSTPSNFQIPFGGWSSYIREYTR